MSCRYALRKALIGVALLLQGRSRLASTQSPALPPPRFLSPPGFVHGKKALLAFAGQKQVQGPQEEGPHASKVFDCPAVAPAKLEPTDVRELHPGHISVIMAIGDSITAGFAAKGLDSVVPEGESAGTTARLGTPVALPLEYRWLSFSGGGGSRDAYTLPFFFNRYNASLSGFSTATTIPQTPATRYSDLKADALNLALSNAHSWQIDMEVTALLKQTSLVPNFADRWKVLTIMIGANDICDGMPSDSGGPFAACNGNATNAVALVDRYEHMLRSALTKVRDKFSRVVVQLVSLFSIASVDHARVGNRYCAARKAILSECNCLDRDHATGSTVPSPSQLRNLDSTIAMLNNRLHKLAHEFNLQRPDFAVIEQVAGRNQAVPDMSYLSSLDCFHPSAKAHALSATALWNGLFDPQRKPTPLDSNSPPFCPAADTVIFIEAPSPIAGSRVEMVV